MEEREKEKLREIKKEREIERKRRKRDTLRGRGDRVRVKKLLIDTGQVGEIESDARACAHNMTKC